MLMGCAGVSMFSSFLLMHETKAVGTRMFNLASLKENVQLIQSYVHKFFSSKMIGGQPIFVEGKGHDDEKAKSGSDSDSSPTKAKSVKN